MKPIRQKAKPSSWAEKFSMYVDKSNPDECWEWRGTRDSNGYGVAYHEGVQMGAHRLSVILHQGEIPEGLSALHKCDNPPCCNPAHLFVGTRRENMFDCLNKGRTRRSWGPSTRHRDIPEFLTTGQAAKIVGVSGQTVINWIDQGRFEANRFDRGPRRIPCNAFIEYLKKSGFVFPKEFEWISK